MIKAIVDANAVLRYLTHDVIEQSEKFKKCLLKVEDKKLELFLEPITVVEIIYHLENTYKQTRVVVSLAISRFIEESGVITKNREETTDALLTFSRQKNIDFVDIYLATLAKSEKKKVLSFDRDFDKLDKNIRLKP